MYFETLALEVNAKIAGLEVSKPATLKGKSGTTHRFTFLALEGPSSFGFDICAQVGEVEILRAFVKKLDTGAECMIVSLSGRPNEEAAKMASLYDVKILGPGDVGNFFSGRIAKQIQTQGRRLAR